MDLDPARGYDLIGDVHGCADALERLLATLGYRLQDGIWRHSRRMAVFFGDLVDRGTRIRDVHHGQSRIQCAGLEHAGTAR